MLFNSIHFMIFFPVVVGIYFLIPRKARYIWLLVSSYYFYMSWNPEYALLIACSTLVTYVSGRQLASLKKVPQSPKTAVCQKWVVALCLAVNLGILVFFKYSDFILNNFNHMLGILGVSQVRRKFDILLPVGISFYTFQALGYTIDVYRGKVEAEKNLLRYALFVSFFPQLVAGPIERSGNLIAQLNHVEDIRLWNYERITGGAVLMLWGLFQKMVIADRAAFFVDTVYNGYWRYGSIELILATVLFAVQIYCDFASYSLIAVGAARVMGIRLMENFDTPYFARSVKEFWRRWHVSLSSWFRDYLYIPLGGSRCSKLCCYRNIMITFLVSGLWHGASWSFVVWGGLHGAYQVIGDRLRPVKMRIEDRLKIKRDCFSYKLGQVLTTFGLVNVAWVFFRAASLKEAFFILGRIVTGWNPWVLSDQSLYQLGLDVTEVHILAVSLLALFLVDQMKYKTGKTLDLFLREQLLWFRWLVLFTLLFGIIIYGIYGPAFSAAAFIYFQF